MFPLLAGTPQASLLFNLAFVVVLASLLIQGTSIGWVARKLGVAMPDPTDERGVRAVFRDFALDPTTPARAVCDFHGLHVPSEPSTSLGDWMAAELRRPPVAGDSLTLGPAVLVVRRVEDGRIASIVLGLPVE